MNVPRSGDDLPRLLAERSEQGYTTSTIEALNGEPEAVPEEEQQRQTREAHERAADRRKADYRASRSRIEREVAELREVLGREFGSDLRVIERVLDRIDRSL